MLERSSRLAGPATVAVGTAALCCAVLVGNPTVPGGPLPVCPTKALLGIDCPGCGSLRMIYSLLHGDLSAALHYNALALVALPLLAVSFVGWAAGRWRGRRIAALAWPTWRWSPHITLVLVLAWFVIRNIPLAPFTALRV